MAGATVRTPAVEGALQSTATITLRFDDVTKAYGRQVVVESTNLTLNGGEILTLLGPSGCGKTTTLRMAIGLERASRGRIWFDGALVDAPAQRVFVPPEKRSMGMVFQSYAIWPHLTVFENVAYPLRARKRPSDEIRAAVMAVLEQVGLAAFAQRPGTKLSGGQQQRVAIARCLAFGPDTLLMDEPFSNLDKTLREQMRREIKLLQRKLGIAVLFVTHDQEEALALSDRIAVMRAGRIEQIGAPTELYADPQTSSVRDFLGRTILLPGRVNAREGRSVTVALDEGTYCVCAGADRARAAGVGARVLATIRPERIRVEDAPAHGSPASPAANGIPGEILALLFLGDRFEAEVRLPSGAIVAVMLPAAQGWREGARVTLVVPAEFVDVWPVERADA